MQLALLHRALGTEAVPDDAATWRTCLREIHFLPNRDPQPPGTIIGADAYGLLLEVVCGLRSPLIGETEVQAQFKQFLASPDSERHVGLRRLGQRVLGDAKRIRHKHLQGFGAHSYGQLTAAHVTGDRVAVVGNGALARQVVMSVPGHLPVDVWGRSGRRLAPTGGRSVRFALIGDAPAASGTVHDRTTIVVAAPVGPDDLSSVVSVYSDVSCAIDLRSLDQLTPIHRTTRVVLLSELLAEAGQSELGAAPRLRAARADIRRLAQSFEQSQDGRSAARRAQPIVGCGDVCA